MHAIRIFSLVLKSFVPLLLVLCTSLATKAQPQYVLENEHALTSFYTKQHKRVVIAVDNDDRYIVYRYGTTKKIELEYPERDTASWRKMQFYWYLRPSMGVNDGFDMYNISFVTDSFRYVVAQSNSGDEGGENLDVTVLDLKGKIIARFPGNLRTQKGHLMGLRTYEDAFSRGAQEYEDPNIN